MGRKIKIFNVPPSVAMGSWSSLGSNISTIKNVCRSYGFDVAVNDMDVIRTAPWKLNTAHEHFRVVVQLPWGTFSAQNLSRAGACISSN